VRFPSSLRAESTQNEKGDILAIFPTFYVTRRLNIPDIRPPRALIGEKLSQNPLFSF